MRRGYLLLLLCAAFISITASAQDRHIGAWRAHLPYNIVVGVATDGQTLYAAGEKSFFTYNSATGEYETFSKVEGMHDINPNAVGWDDATGTAIIAYANSNVDLYRQHSFTNIPDIKQRSFAGSKTVNHIYTSNGLAYLSTGLGIVVINLNKPEVKETYVFTKNGQTLVNYALTASGPYFYSATSQGLYRTPRASSSLQAFSTWQAVDSTRNFRGVVDVNGQVFATGTDSLFAVTNNGLQFVYRSDTNSTHLDAGNGVAYLSVYYSSKGYGKIKVVSPTTLQVIDSLDAGFPRGTVVAGGGPWVADQFGGLTSYDPAGARTRHIPRGPRSYTSFDILPYDRDVYVAHGGFSEGFDPQENGTGISHFSNNAWPPYSDRSEPYLGDSVRDVIALAKDPKDGTLYCGTYNTGLVAIHPGGNVEVIKQGVLDPSAYSSSAIAFDKDGSLWVGESRANNYQLAVRTSAGQWYSYISPASGSIRGASVGMIVDDYNQKWYAAPRGGGAIVYNDNHTPDNGADDLTRAYTKSVGNLPSDEVYCVAKDREGPIWVGTADGIGIISCGVDATNPSCQAEIPIRQFDQFADYLFKNEAVHTIAVDGGNRKWIGTTNGVWLISPQGDKVLLRFTVDNSPLPSNNIRKIAVDPITGDVWIGTEEGLVSYRGTATEGGETNDDHILAFPNPVPSGYTGSIAIRGLVTDADVRITDISGQLIYRTKAAGGQAVWNGLDYTGHRPQSGVLLVFASDKLGTQTAIGKILFQH